MPLPDQNLLADQTSPYLLQHAANPVHWRPWARETLREAAELDRPILLSIGYAACHWCHVMAHESFENKAIAALMNRYFVNIKVDREERPDIDQTYMAALAAMGEQGGWPLTMFLTPDAKPFWGGTYFPPTARHGRPGFDDVLQAINKAWLEKRQGIAQNGVVLADHVRTRLAATDPPAPIELESLRALAAGIHNMTDPEHGGLRGAPKFLNAAFLQTLWLSWLTDGNAEHRDAVLKALRGMLRGGIYDHVGGGLARYSTDAEWLVPHFEKMLYDNSQLIRQACWAYAQTSDHLFRIRIEETVAWMLREMRVQGGFASSLDADSEGEEGLFYTWSAAELQEALGDDAATIEAFLGLRKPPAWEGKPVLAQTEAQLLAELASPSEASRLKQRLLNARAMRVRPGLDDKVLTDWNGLAIAALAEAGRLLARQEWIDAAAAAFDAIAATAGDGGQLPHSTRSAARLYPALSVDYAAMANAAVSLFEATLNPAYLGKADAFLAALDRFHKADDGSGHFLSAANATDVPIRIRGDVDEAMPSATAQIIEATIRLASATGSLELHEKAETLAEHALGRIARQAYGQAGIVNAAAIVAAPMTLVIVDDPRNPQLVPAANRNPDPRRVDIVLAVGSNTAVSLPGNMIPSTEKIGAYLCRGQICLPAITDADYLEKQLRRLG